MDAQPIILFLGYSDFQAGLRESTHPMPGIFV